MSKFKIVNLIDKLFVSVCVFLILYAWLNFYIKNLWVTFVLSVVFSFACLFVLFYVFDKKNNKVVVNAKTNEEINKNFLAFKLSSGEQKMNLIAQLYCSTLNTQLKNNQLIVIKNDLPCLVFVETEKETLTQNDVFNIISKSEQKYAEIDIVCENFASNIKTNILANVKVNLINKSVFFELCKANKIYPNTSNINWDTTKLKFKDILKGFFEPNKAKSYFFCGLVLIFSAIILPYHIYYLLFGSMLLCFSIICKIKGSFC